MKERDEPLTYEQQANSDKLVVLKKIKQPIHITLNRVTRQGKRYFYNGLITKIHSPTLFDLQDLKTQEVYTFSIFEIKDGGINKYTLEELK